MAGASSFAASFRTRGGILSGPGALCGLSLERSFATPSVLILMSCMVGALVVGVGGIEDRSSLVKTEENWSLRISAFIVRVRVG